MQTHYFAVAALIASAASPAVAQQSRPSSNEVVTVIGCVQPESDYRKQVNAGKGGAVGSGAGVENEYVLTDAKPAEGGARGGAAVYSITGRLEKELKRSIGRQVEVVGFVENPSAKGSGTGDVSDLPRINVNVWHPVADFCPAK